ncbi:MAG: translation initiation factor IF-2 [Gemmatimonadetes bacterium]|nr:translation initiation factor IF-2 [Gemmatimonadota bacterium]NNF12756.1 translation initiation factor IF-2 [Gemmatimonadota bacterium]
MQVFELADDLKVDADSLIALLRHMGIPVSDEDATISDGQMAKVLAKVERERRAGHKDPAEAIRAAMEEAAPSAPRRRRRRRRAEPEPEAVEEEAEDDEAPEAEAEDVESTSEDSDEEESDEGDDTDEVTAEDDSDESDDVDDEEDEVEAEADDADEGVEAEAEEEAEAEADSNEPEAEADDEASEALQEAQEEASEDGLAPARAGQPDGPVRTIRRPTPAPAASAGPGGQVRIQAEGYTADGRRQRKDRKKGQRRGGVDQTAVQENIQRVMAEIKGGGGKKKRKKGRRLSAEEQEAQEQEAQEQEERERRTVRVNEFLTVAELGELVDVTSTEIIGSAFKNLGLMVTINQRLDFDQIELLLEEFNYTVEREEEYVSEAEVEEEEVDAPEDLKPRSPVVTVMGHVDHGKTLLLDRIRETNVVAGEAGGITQHIGAYHVELESRKSLTFLDTPGHAAFTAMRARGADVTDIVILIVAADDSVMPQTIEAISHAKNAGVPMIVAVNKIDLPAADPMRVKQELLQHSVNVEDFGGDVLVAEISAKTGQGIEDLLEKVLLQAELLELTANPDRDAVGTVIEAQLDQGKGAVATVLVQKGTLRVGDSFICGLYDGRVKALLDERGHSVKEAGPAVPVQVLGAGGVPQAGDTFQAMAAVQAAEIAGNRQRLDREKQLRIRERGIKLGDFGALVEAGQVSNLPLVIKGDVDGSVQALSDALEQLGTSEVQVEVIHRGVGAINESDVLLAQTSGAVIIGFRVRPQTAARQQAEREDVDIHVYDVIYEAVDEVTAALEGMLAPEKRETIEGTAEVREVFKVSKVGTIAGCYVSEGRIDRKGHARLIRDGIVVYDGEIGSLKRFKDDVKEVREGFECGIGIQNFNDIKVGDLIECYTVEEVARTLASST